MFSKYGSIPTTITTSHYQHPGLPSQDHLSGPPLGVIPQVWQYFKGSVFFPACYFSRSFLVKYLMVPLLEVIVCFLIVVIINNPAADRHLPSRSDGIAPPPSGRTWVCLLGPSDPPVILWRWPGSGDSGETLFLALCALDADLSDQLCRALGFPSIQAAQTPAPRGWGPAPQLLTLLFSVWAQRWSVCPQPGTFHGSQTIPHHQLPTTLNKARFHSPELCSTNKTYFYYINREHVPESVRLVITDTWIPFPMLAKIWTINFENEKKLYFLFFFTLGSGGGHWSSWKNVF